MRAALRLVPVVLAAAAAAGHAQGAPDSARTTQPLLRITLERAADGSLGAPVVRPAVPIAGSAFGAALHDGFPVRLAFRLELRHSVRIFADRLEKQAEWEAVVLLDPLTNEYSIIRSGGTEEHFTTVRAVERALATAFRVDLMPQRPGQYYYVATMEIESLSLSELAEVERWLRGDVGSAVASEGNVGDALAHGVRRLLVRLSGLPRRRVETRSPFFTP